MKIQDCDRAYLRSALNTYLSAVLGHAPTLANLAAAHRATENAVDVEPGMGIWKSATSLGKIQRRYADPLTRQALYFGTLMEGDSEAIVALRIRVDGSRRVSEAEWTIARETDGNKFDLAGLHDNPPPPEGLRDATDTTPRQEMVFAANAYFTGLENHDGSKVPHICGCDRIENGYKQTNRLRTIPGVGSNPASEERSGDCTADFESLRTFVSHVYPRRYIVDEEQGVVIGQVITHRPLGSERKRNLLTEMFYLKNGKIAQIQAAMYYIDNSMPDTPGW